MNPEEIRRVGPYPVKRFLAEGGMAWVFLVVDPRFEGHEVLRALKLLKPEAAAGEEFERFRQEAALLAGIDHPNLVTIFDFGKDDPTGCFFYTMTFVDGPSMSQRVREGGALEEGDAIGLFADLLGGLAELHRRGIVHRDIKPANVLIGGDGRARVSDLGIARSERGTGRTKTGTAVGTVLYMSPEQARGRDAGATSDVFSAGLTLYEALTGRVVYDAVGDIDSTSSYEVLGYLGHLSRTGEEIEVDFTAGGRISKGVADVVRRACRFAPEDRFPNAGEMRQALLAARQGQEAAAAPTSRLWLGGVAAVALLGLAAVGWWAWERHIKIIDDKRAEQIARDLVAEVRRLDGILPALLERARDLPSPPGTELLEAIDDRVRAGRSELEEAEKALEQRKLAITNYQAPRALEEYADACRQLIAGHLGARSDTDAAAARSRAEGLRQDGAPEHLPELWQKLEQRLPGLGEPTGADCDLASAHLERIAVASAVLSDAHSLEAQMKTVWPELAEKARGEAEKQRKLAKAEVVDAREYATRVSSAEEAFARGDSLLKESEYLRARDAFDGAAKSFEDAAAIVPAAKARAQVRKLEEDAQRLGGFDPGRASLVIADADRQFQAGAYADAVRTYQEAIVEMKKGMKDQALKGVAEDARVRARVAREAALKEGAEQADAAGVASADLVLQEGEKELTAGRYDQAELRFKEAEKGFSDLRTAAIEFFADARELERSVRADLASCKSFESGTARELCGSAQQDAAAGSSALEQRRVSEALRALRGAQASVQQARSAEDLYREKQNWDPKIVKRNPQREKLDVPRNEVVKLSVEANDDNKQDQLTYHWSFEGRELTATGPQVEFRPEGAGTAEVAVEDGRGGRAQTSWQVAMLNRRPDVTLTPSGSTVKVDVDEEARFSARIQDPDGDAVTAQWKLDGKPVGEGESYAFVARKPGPYKLSLVATDSGGAAREVTRSIQVQGKAPPPEPEQMTKVEPPPQPQQVAKVEPRPEPKVEPARSGAGVVFSQSLEISEKSRGELERMFDRYRQAILNRDMERFKDLFVQMESFDETIWKGRFEKPQDLDVRILVKKAKQTDPKTLDVLVEQTLIWDGKPDGRPSIYGMKLRGWGTGDWQIAKQAKGGI